MKKLTTILLCLLLVTLDVTAQVIAKPVRKVATLSMPGETGNNGGSVVWHPVLKKYYASFAGNASYPMGVFDPTGKLISPEDIETMFDTRGLWYNTITKRIEANGYADYGWIAYKLSPKGIPIDTAQILEGQNQPDEQSLGVFDAVKKKIAFLSGNIIVYYSLQGQALDESIELKIASDDEEAMEDELTDDVGPMENYNATALCYTGIPNAEFAILNYSKLQIEMYNRKGVLTKALQLPDEAVVYNNFNFAYANNIWWLFDKVERKWFGYK